VLAADAELDPAPAARALPLRLALTATVAGRPPAADVRRSGRLRLELRLRNTTAVRTQAFLARSVSAAAARAVASRVVSQVRQGGIPDQPILEVEGPIRTREVAVDAPLVVRGEVRLAARGLDDAVATGGSLVRRGDGVAVRFRLVLGGTESTSATIVLTGSVRGASFPHAVVTAEPSAVAALPVAAGGRDAADGAARLLLSVARVHQYDAFLANPAPGGPVQAVYRFTTVVQPSAAVVPPDSNTSGHARTAIVLLLAVLGAGGLAVLWAHL
jgi:hypothetical protein